MPTQTAFRKPALIVAAILMILIVLAAVFLMAQFYFSTAPVAPVAPSPSSSAIPQQAEQYPPAGNTTAWAVESHTEAFSGTLPPTPVLTGLRTAKHDGYDRIAFDFKDHAAPGYTIGYVDAAIRDGSGEPVSMTGRAVLQVIFTPADAHDSDGNRTTDAPINPRTTGYPGLQSYAMTGDFEAHTTFALGVSGRNGYQIRQFQNGDKWTVYIDVRH